MAELTKRVSDLEEENSQLKDGHVASAPMPPASEISPVLMDQYLTELFAMADANRNGVLEKEEFAQVTMH